MKRAINVLQVLLLDADSQPLLDPASLFELESFTQNGNIFWPDYWAEGFSEVSLSLKAFMNKLVQA